MATTATPNEKEKVKTNKDVDTSNGSRGVWLVKVPKYIAERWENAASTGQRDAGSLKIQHRPHQKPLVSFSLADALTKATDNPDIDQKTAIPKEYNFQMSQLATQTLEVFTHTSNESGDKLALEGKVGHRAECRPINNKTYMDLKKDSIVRAIEPTRKAMTLKAPVNAYKPVSNHASNLAYEAKKKTEGKKARDDKDAVMEMLFALFEKHQYYKINDLVKHTRQPVTYLKEILKDVCTYNMKNPHKNMWELKPEYRHYKQEEVKDEAKEDEDDFSDDD